MKFMLEAQDKQNFCSSSSTAGKQPANKPTTTQKEK
jgi:hypothetical protein